MSGLPPRRTTTAASTMRTFEGGCGGTEGGSTTWYAGRRTLPPCPSPPSTHVCHGLDRRQVGGRDCVERGKRRLEDGQRDGELPSALLADGLEPLRLGVDDNGLRCDDAARLVDCGDAQLDGAHELSRLDLHRRRKGGRWRIQQGGSEGKIAPSPHPVPWRRTWLLSRSGCSAAI